MRVLIVEDELERQRHVCAALAASMGLEAGEMFQDQAGERSVMRRLHIEAASTFLADMAAAGVQVHTVTGSPGADFAGTLDRLAHDRRLSGSVARHRRPTDR